MPAKTMALRALLLLLLVLAPGIASESTLIGELERLSKLYDAGALTASEFAASKARLISGDAPPPSLEEVELAAIVSRVVLRHQQAINERNQKVFDAKLLEMQAAIDELLRANSTGDRSKGCVGEWSTTEVGVQHHTGRIDYASEHRPDDL